MRLEIKYTQQGIEYRSPFDRGLVAELKAKIPQNDRKPIYSGSKFDCWLIHSKHKKTLDDLSMSAFGRYPDTVGVPKAQNTGLVTKLLAVKYIGMPRDRGSGNPVSFACDMAENWNMIFSEQVLRDWFECGIGGQQQNVSAETLYGVLAVARTAAGIEIKKAYRRMAKRFHPDICKDDDAEEMFRKVQNAYEVLSDPPMRRRYDAGLTLEASLQHKTNWQENNRNSKYYRPPLRCGLIMAEGRQEVGRFVVSQILQWQPIKRGGYELVTSFDRFSEKIVEQWI